VCLNCVNRNNFTFFKILLGALYLPGDFTAVCCILRNSVNSRSNSEGCLPDFMMTLLTNLCLIHNTRNGCVYSCLHCTRSCADFCGLVENVSDKRRWAAYTESGCAPRPISVRLQSWPVCSRRCLHVRKRLSRVAECDYQRVCLTFSSNIIIKHNPMQQSRS
jgi:hypothetical protein